jgi:hypothetical protein
VASGFLSRAKAFLKRIADVLVRYPLAAAATVFLVVAAVALAASGKSFQIGGILQKLWGAKRPENPRATVADGRKAEDGRPVEPGLSDDKGFVQSPVSTEIVEPGIFSNPDTVTVVHPEKGKVVIDLPEGVKNKDVHEVTEISPDVYEVKNRDKGVPVKKLDDVLKKF